MSRILSAPLFACLIWCTVGATKTFAQERPAPPVVISPDVAADRTVTFRLLASKATAVKVVGGDTPGMGRGLEMTKGDKDIWSVTTSPINPGTYRYHFDVDGLGINDPKNPATSESNTTSWSVFVVPGSDEQDAKDIPHGSVARVTYYSKTLQKTRRMTVYTPPGYESGTGTFPVLYLLHGSSDSDDSWISIGRANFILDNLIASGNAKPMIVVMPHGHTNPPPTDPPEAGRGRQTEEFVADFNTEIRPRVERTYRVKTDRASRAIAGLSMGGGQSLEISMRNLGDYGYVGVFSSGIFGIVGDRPRPPGPKWEERHQSALDQADLKPGLKLFWFATGKDDFLVKTTQATVDLLKQHGFDVVYHETAGGHTWINWRDYLHQFAPLLFNEPAAAAR